MDFSVFQTNDRILQNEKSIVIAFSGPRKVLSTSPLNGGYREDLTHVFNHDCMNSNGIAVMNGRTYREHMINTVRSLGLDPETTAGLETGVPMHTAAFSQELSGKTCVSVIATAGVSGNAARAGDRCSWDEAAESGNSRQVGTINLIVNVNADLTGGAMASALATVTEAKTAVMQELAVPSCYSQGIATGTGTDGTVIISDRESPCLLTEAGKHTKLGELLGRCVIHAVKSALLMNRNYSDQQHDAVKRLSRFGIETNGTTLRTRCRKEFVTAAALFARLLDEYSWGLLDRDELILGSKWIFESCAKSTGKDFRWDSANIHGKEDLIRQWNQLLREP